MKKILISFLLGAAALTASPSQVPLGLEDSAQLVVHNRVLVKIHQKAISVLDVAKEMELNLSSQFPEYANSPSIKFQFFNARWKETLLHMIDQELILADAEKLELKISDGEIRETLLEKFGPNVMETLSALHLSYDEARDLVYRQMVEQRMFSFKVYEKAFASISSKDIKVAYEEYCKNNPPKELWNYEVVSVRAKDEEVAKQVANQAFALCSLEKEGLQKVQKELVPATEEGEAPLFSISVSSPMEKEEKELSAAHKSALETMRKGEVSAPLKQASRASDAIVYRIFHLLDHEKQKNPPLKQMRGQLKDQLVNKTIDAGIKAYIGKLREYYGFNSAMLEEILPPDFEPFTLQ